MDQLNSTNAPFINRALEPRYPGSVFKTVVAAAALESNVADENTSYVDTGYIEKGGHTFKCPSYVTGGHGKVTLKDAFALSCNTAFIDLGCKTGAKAIVDCAKRLGVGEVWDLGMGNTKRGTLPTPPLGDASVANFSLGQAVVTMSPLVRPSWCPRWQTGHLNSRPNWYYRPATTRGTYVTTCTLSLKGQLKKRLRRG